MDEQEIRRMLTRIIVDELGVKESEVTDNARLYEDLGADSVDYLHILMVVEKEFGFTICNDEAFAREKSLNIVGNLIELVKERLN
jgi:acyl carrier protein